MIKKIFCSNKHSGILLSNGEFWGSGNCTQPGKENLKNQDEERKMKQINKDKEFLNFLQSSMGDNIENEDDNRGKGKQKGKKKQHPRKVARMNSDKIM